MSGMDAGLWAVRAVATIPVYGALLLGWLLFREMRGGIRFALVMAPMVAMLMVAAILLNLLAWTTP